MAFFRAPMRNQFGSLFFSAVSLGNGFITSITYLCLKPCATVQKIRERKVDATVTRLSFLARRAKRDLLIRSMRRHTFL